MIFFNLKFAYIDSHTTRLRVLSRLILIQDMQSALLGRMECLYTPSISNIALDSSYVWIWSHPILDSHIL